ncbi:DUF485 domain-containing protein [Nocardioides sp. R-C-SC26]|uniref:DUF485 domain-containing protein n=1 Tax=Nocardioides sp. R-C-SC26 TaxID=2870414 RepID=UPI001E65C9B6|nr:DUF485 domain-containing protein [Nocardioides sp. R-C-SC26]
MSHADHPAQPGGGDAGHQQAARHDPVYDHLHASAEFAELRRRYRAFVLPATVAFLSWYLLYVVMSNWAAGFMSTQVLGNINIALVFGLLQFVTTFLIAYLYSRYSAARLDPLAGELEERFVETGATGSRGGKH